MSETFTDLIVGLKRLTDRVNRFERNPERTNKIKDLLTEIWYEPDLTKRISFLKGGVQFVELSIETYVKVYGENRFY